MIHGPYHRDPLLSTIAKLIDSPFLFEFTGSRANRIPRVDSDYDFVTEHNEEVVAFLSANMTELNWYPEEEEPAAPESDDSLMFLMKKEPRKLDVNTHSVFRYGPKEGPKIDVCVVFALDKRIIMIDYVTSHYLQEQQKAFSTEDWNKMYDLCLQN